MTLRLMERPVNRSLVVAGVALALASLLVAAWTLRLGDVVTALGLTLLVAAGSLLAGIGLSSDTMAH